MYVDYPQIRIGGGQGWGGGGGGGNSAHLMMCPEEATLKDLKHRILNLFLPDRVWIKMNIINKTRAPIKDNRRNAFETTVFIDWFLQNSLTFQNKVELM